MLTALLQFFMSYTMAMLAFWVLEVSTFIFILFAFEYIASGHLFPLDILPRGLEQALFFTPFPYQLYFPVSIYMGKTAGADMIRGLLIQGSVGDRRLRPGAIRLAPGHQEVFRSRRVTMKSETRSPKSEVANVATQHATRNTGHVSRFTHHASRYLSIYAALWKNSVTREMSFKSNFLLWILVELLWFGLQLSFIGVLYLHTEHIGTWTKWQVVMLIGAQPFHPADLPGLLSRQLHEPVRVGAHRQTGLPAVAAGQHALRRVAPAGGPGRLRQRRLRGGADGLCRAPTAPGPDAAAGAGLPGALRGGHRDSLLV